MRTLCAKGISGCGEFEEWVKPEQTDFIFECLLCFMQCTKHFQDVSPLIITSYKPTRSFFCINKEVKVRGIKKAV